MVTIWIRFWRNSLWTLSVTLLAACGGGGGGTGSSGGSGTGGGPAVQTGTLIDGPVRGVHYQTATQTGSTDANGQFKYLANETVTFSVGGVQLGSATAATQLSPFDLAGITHPSTEGELRAALGDASFTAFDRALNIALLLASLDGDHNPDNGLDVTGWDSALTGASLDFNSDWRDFRDKTFNHFAHSYQINLSVSPTALLTHLYGSLNITAAASVLDRKETNLSTGATLDATIDAATGYAYEFDSSGHVLKVTQAIDANADGTADSRAITAYTYDAAGKIAMKARGSDANADGVIDDIGKTTDTYGASENVLNEVGKILGPSNSVLTDTRTFTYAANGDLATQFRDVEVISANGGGVSTGAHPLSILTTYSYDTGGNRLAAAHHHVRCGYQLPTVCSTYEYTDAFTYDAHGNLLTALRINFTGGSMAGAFTETYSYDAGNNLLVAVTPTWFTPVVTDPTIYIAVPTTTTYAYSANGKLLSKVVETPYFGERATTTYDVRGNELTLVEERDPNGPAISRDTYTYTYDANGNRLTELHQSDTNADGVVDSTTEVRNIYTLIDNGLIYLFQEFGGQL